MVIRVVQGRVRHGAEGEFNAFMRDVRLPDMRRQAGFVYGKFGRQIHADGERFVFVSEWRDVASLYAWVGSGDLTAPVTIRGAEHLVADVKVELYEALDVPLHPETSEPMIEPPPAPVPEGSEELPRPEVGRR